MQFYGKLKVGYDSFVDNYIYLRMRKKDTANSTKS